MEINDQEFNLAVQRLRDEPIKTLHFSPAVEKLLDHSSLIELEHQMSIGASRWERFRATRDLGTQLPREKGVYMFVWAPGPKFEFEEPKHRHEVKWILYIGKAGVKDGVRDSLRDRYQSYQRLIGGDPTQMWSSSPARLGREQKLKTFLSLRPLEYWCLVMNDDRYIAAMERRLLGVFRPPLNVSDTLRARLGKERPAW